MFELHFHIRCIVFLGEVQGTDFISKAVTHLDRHCIEELCWFPVANLTKRVAISVEQILSSFTLQLGKLIKCPHLAANLGLNIHVEDKRRNHIHLDAHLLKGIGIQTLDADTRCNVFVTLRLILINGRIDVGTLQLLVGSIPCVVCGHEHHKC